MKKIVVLFIILIVIPQVSAQYMPPTLESGLNNLVYSKGTLDVELISAIISEKQNELQKEAIKRIIIKTLSNGNFAFTNYTQNVINLLLHEKNKNVITKELLERTTNLALVYSFAEFYLQVEWNARKSQDSTFFKVIDLCHTRPSYLNINEQANWLTAYREKRDSVNIQRKLFRLKADDPDSLKKQYDDLSRLVTNLERNRGFQIYNNDKTSIHRQILILQKLFQLYENKYPTEFKNKNLNAELFQTGNNEAFENDFQKYINRIEISLQYQNLTKSTESLASLKNSIKQFSDMEYNRYLSKTSQDYEQLYYYQDLISSIDSLHQYLQSIIKINKTKPPASNIFTFYFKKHYKLYKKILSEKIDKNHFAIDTLLKFKQLIDKYKATPSQHLQQQLEQLHKRLLKEYVSRRLRALKRDECRKLGIILSDRAIFNLLQNKNYKTVMDEWHQFLKKLGFPSFAEIKVWDRNRILLQKINYQTNVYELLMAKSTDYPQICNYECHIENILNFKYFIENNKVKQTNKTRNYYSFLMHTLENAPYNKELYEYRQLFQALDSLKHCNNFIYPTKFLSDKHHDLLVDTQESKELSNNTHYNTLKSYFEKLASLLSNKQLYEKYLLSIKKDTSLLEKTGMQDEYSALVLAYESFNEEKDAINKRISDYGEAIKRFNKLKQTEDYKTAPNEIKYQYSQLLEEFRKLKRQEKERLNIKGWDEYREFIGGLIDWKINTEKQAIVLKIKQIKKQSAIITQINEYNKLLETFRRYDISNAFNQTVNQLYDNQRLQNEKLVFERLKSKPEYTLFNKKMVDYKPYFQNTDNYDFVQNISELSNMYQNIKNRSDDNTILRQWIEVENFKAQYHTARILLAHLKNAIEKDNNISLNMILIDMIYDICITSEVVKENGFFRHAKGISPKGYLANNSYYRLQKTDPEFFDALEPLRQSIKKRMEFFFKYYQLIQEMNYFNNQSIANIRNNYIGLLQKSLLDTVAMKSTEITGIYSNLHSSLDTTENIFNSVQNHFKIVLSEQNKIKAISQKLEQLPETFSEKNSSEINNYWQENNPVNEIKNLVIYVSTDSIFSAMKRIQSNLEHLPENIKIQVYHDKIATLSEKYSHISEIRYSEEIVNEDRRFINLYTRYNNTFLNYISEFKELIDAYRREIIANILNGNDYLNINVKLFKESINNFRANNLADDDKEKLAEVYGYISMLEKPNNNVLTFDFLNFLRTDIIPQLVAINIKYDQLDSSNQTVASSMQPAKQIAVTNLENILNYGYFIRINDFFDPENLISPEIISMSMGFVNIVSRLNRLDEVKTYEYVLKTMADAGNIFPEAPMMRTFNDIINNVIKYTQLDEENTRLTLDVESFISVIDSRYQMLSHNRINFYFSVGISQNLFLNKTEFTDKENNTYTLKDIGFASEKIGVKYNLINFNKRRYKSILRYNYADYKSQKPYINDIHLILFGSGLLYNIANTTTSKKQFTYPLAGIGTGITFYNSLDFNLTCSMPFTDKPFDKLLFGVAFDIKIGEYLEALNKNRKKQKMMQ